MAKIPVSKLLSIFHQMRDEHWKYVAGGASTGEVDCSGAFVYAYAKYGLSIYHGSNRIARTEVEDLTPIKEATIEPGMVAFKSRKPDQVGYSLPDEYQNGGAHYNKDLNDYYHMGLIDSETAYVINAQSSQTGVVSSPISERWSYVGHLKQVEYDDSHNEDVPSIFPREATVYAENNGPVRIRTKPSVTNSGWEWVPTGATVTVTGPIDNGFYPITFGKKKGWMMEEFLILEGDGAMPDTYSINIKGLSITEATALAERYPAHDAIKKEK